MAVMLTCTGKRYDIVAAFRALGDIVATDRNPMAPAQYAATHRVIPPPVDDPDYVPALIEACERYGVEALVPLTDLDIEVLAGARDRFARSGVCLFVPDPEIALATMDKYVAHRLFRDLGLPSPPTHLPDALPDDIHYPVLVKPRRGSGARNLFKAEDRAQTEFFVGYVDEPVMVQRFMDGPEFSMDILCDPAGTCLNVIPRTMLESRGGESIKGEVIRDSELIDLGRRVGELLPCRGPATIQCFRDPEIGLGLTDVNCRFGGAFPAPIFAGGSYPELIVRLARGERIEPHVGRFDAGRRFTRYFWQLELVDGGGGELAPTGRDIVAGGPPSPHPSATG